MSMGKIWNEVSEKKRRQLLKTRGLHPSFAKVKNFDNLSKRDGGHVKRDLEKLYNQWQNKR